MFLQIFPGLGSLGLKFKRVSTIPKESHSTSNSEEEHPSLKSMARDMEQAADGFPGLQERRLLS